MQRELEQLRQGSLNAGSFFQQFELLRRKAEYSGKEYNAYIISLVEKNVR